MGYTAINLTEKFSKFSDQWAPKIIAQMNDYYFKLVKIEGEFVWHSHTETDEVFVMLVEAAGTLNTGEVTGQRTAADGIWI